MSAWIRPMLGDCDRSPWLTLNTHTLGNGSQSLGIGKSENCSLRQINAMCHDISKHNVDLIFFHVCRASLVKYISGWHCIDLVLLELITSLLTTTTRLTTGSTTWASHKLFFDSVIYRYLFFTSLIKFRSSNLVSRPSWWSWGQYITSYRCGSQS